MESGYLKGYTQGIADGLSKVNVQYTYHVHTGDSASEGGCYTKANMIQYITGYQNKTTRCQGRLQKVSDPDGSVYSRCPLCGGKEGADSDGDICNDTVTTQVPVYGTKQDGWLLNCGKTGETIESATIIY